MEKFKTNAMRLLDKAGINYNSYSYEYNDGQIDGISVADKMGQPVEQVYKTLVTKGASKEYFVFVIPVAEELDLKEAAKAVGEKAIAMIKLTEINKVTGYIRGGCSPIGMKKDYKTKIDSSCEALETFIISAGKIGYQIELAPKDLLKFSHCSLSQIAVKRNNE